MGAGPEARSLRGERVSAVPRERKRRTETTEQGARPLLRELGHPASPSRGRLDTFPPAALRKQARHCARSQSVRTPQGEYGLTPSTGFSLFLTLCKFQNEGTPKGLPTSPDSPEPTVQKNEKAGWD